jgi:hypothetical protein
VNNRCIESGLLVLCQFAQSDKQFKVRAQMNQCSINMPIELIPEMKTRHPVSANMDRFPVLTNHATTGHKLQGQLDENNNLESVTNDDGTNQLSFMSLNKLRGNDWEG